MSARLPVFLITGSPKSGKSTLLQRVVSAPDFPAEQTALIINHADPLNLEARIFRNRALEVEAIGGGCLCCTSKNVVTDCLSRFSKDPRLKQAWVEASGGAVIEDLIKRLKESPLTRRIELRKVVHVVSGEKFEEAGIDPGVALADLLFVSQLDRVPLERRTKIRAALKQMNARARWLESRESEGEVLDLHANSLHYDLTRR